MGNEGRVEHGDDRPKIERTDVPSGPLGVLRVVLERVQVAPPGPPQLQADDQG